METTDSLERSLGAFSITDDGDDEYDAASSSSLESRSPAAITAEFNSHLFLRHQWEQCLDLKTGDIYYVDLRNGRKVKGADLRRYEYEHVNGSNNNKDHHDEDGEETDLDTEEQYQDQVTDQGEREEWQSLSSSSSSSSSSCISSTEDYLEEEAASFLRRDDVLVVTGCKRCFMYFMLPKIAEHCPKCRSNLLLHFNGNTTML